MEAILKGRFIEPYDTWATREPEVHTESKIAMNKQDKAGYRLVSTITMLGEIKFAIGIVYYHI